jgi:hypothetical protein
MLGNIWRRRRLISKECMLRKRGESDLLEVLLRKPELEVKRRGFVFYLN